MLWKDRQHQLQEGRLSMRTATATASIRHPIRQVPVGWHSCCLSLLVRHQIQLEQIITPTAGGSCQYFPLSSRNRISILGRVLEKLSRCSSQLLQTAGHD